MFTKKMFIVSLVLVFVIGITSAFIHSSVVYAASPEDVTIARGGKSGDGNSPNGRGNGNGGRGVNGQGQNMMGTPTYYQPLSDAEKDGLVKAILEEYGALNLYQSVIEQLGEVSPFVEIARSEQQHVNILIMQAERRGVEVPVNPGLTATVTVANLAEACQMGVQAEIADGALYDELLATTENPALIRVYTNLQAASLNNHLPAFELCSNQ